MTALLPTSWYAEDFGQVFMFCVLQERLADLEESLRSGDVYNERILDLPKRKVILFAHCQSQSRGCLH